MSRFAWPVAATAARSVRSTGHGDMRASRTGRLVLLAPGEGGPPCAGEDDHPTRGLPSAPGRGRPPKAAARRSEDRRGVGERLLRTGAGDLILKGESPVLPTGSAAPRKAELGRATRYSSLVAAPGHGGLIRHILVMRSCCKGTRRPAHRWSRSNRGCPLGTGLVRPMWHASGTGARTNSART
jgi:hypothetical protein